LTRTAIYPGTFDPIHLGHIDIAMRAAEIFDHVVVAIYDRPAKSPLFTLEERMGLAHEAFADYPRIRVDTYDCLTVEFARRIGADAIVRGLRVISDFEVEYQMALTNRQLAPEIEFVCLMTRKNYAFVASSIVKEIALLEGDVTGMVPPHVAEALEAKRIQLDENDKAVPVVSLRD